MIKNSKQDKVTEEAYNKGYRVDNFGEVVGLRGEKLSLGKSPAGYHRFQIRYEGKSTGVLVHKLQAYQKFGKDLFIVGVVVRHINGIETDNSYENIMLGTQSENMMDKPELSRKLDASNPRHNHEGILIDRLIGMSYKDLMKKYNISSKGTMSFIVNNSLKKQGLK